MDQPGPSTHNVIPETPESPSGSNSSEVSTKHNNNIPRVGIEISLGIGLEDSSDEYEEPSSEDENGNNNVDEKNIGPAEQNEPIGYGYDEDYIGDSQFTLYTRRDVYLQGWRTFVRERQSFADFLVPDPPIPVRLNLVLRALCGVNWQQVVLSPSGEVINFESSAAITGFSLTTPRERSEFLRLTGVWPNEEFRAGLRDLACRGGFVDLD